MIFMAGVLLCLGTLLWRVHVLELKIISLEKHARAVVGLTR
jgi:hypothetical protein